MLSIYVIDLLQHNMHAYKDTINYVYGCAMLYVVSDH